MADTVDLRVLLEEGRCIKNHGCNVAATCMCALAEDAIEAAEKAADRIEALQEALRMAYCPVDGRQRVGDCVEGQCGCSNKHLLPTATDREGQ